MLGTLHSRAFGCLLNFRKDGLGAFLIKSFHLPWCKFGAGLNCPSKAAGVVWSGLFSGFFLVFWGCMCLFCLFGFCVCAIFVPGFWFLFGVFVSLFCFLCM